MVQLNDFLALQWCKIHTHSVDTVLQILNSDLFPRLMIGGTKVILGFALWLFDREVPSIS